LRYLKENTATRITVGPFYDVTDGITPEIALTVTNDWLTFIVDDAGVPTLVLDTAPTASGGANDMVHVTSDAGGYYDLELAAANVNYTGRATLSIHDTDVHLPVFHEFQIVSANVYDSLFTDGDLLDVNAAQHLGTAYATPTTAGVPEVDTTHVSGTAQTANDNGADINAILLDTAEIGTAGAGLTNIGTIATVTDVTNQVTADVTAISGDTTAADNLELQYDGTGITDDTFPATQAQMGQLAVGSAAISVQSESYVLTTGTQSSGTISNTETRDGVAHQHTDSGGVMDLYYQFDVGGAGVATEVETFGRINGAGDDLEMQAYDWGNTQWDAIGTFDGQGSSTNVQRTRSLLTRHTGTGANLGKVRVRFYAASGLTTATMHMDQIFTSYAVVSQTVGYANGMIWIDTVGGTAGTETYVNGTADNPVDSLADAVTIAGNLHMHNFYVTSDSSITLAANFQDSNMYGVGYVLDFAGYDCSGTHFYHSSPTTGIVLSASGHIDLLDAIVGNTTVNDSHFTNCSYTGTVTMGAVTSTLRVVNCRSLLVDTPCIFDFGTTAAVSHELSMSDFRNGVEIRNFNNTGTDTMSISGMGTLTIAASCAGGTINIQGAWKVTDNSGGAVTLVYDDLQTEIDAILVDTNELQADWTNGGRLDLIQDEILADTASIGITKNATFSNLEFLMVDATDHVTPETGLTVAGTMSIDGAAFAAVNGTIAEVSNGIYQIDLTADDTNGDVITYRFTSAGAADTFVTIKTRA